MKNMIQFESLRQRMKDLVSSSTQPFATSSTVNEKPNEEEQKILQKIEEQNKLLEADQKSLKSVSSDKSRRNSNSSSSSPAENEDDVDEVAQKLWEQIINNWGNYRKRNCDKLKEHIRQGIPRFYRGIVWQRLCDAYQVKSFQVYPELLKKSSKYEKLIKRDIARTYPEQEFFQGQSGQNILFNVIKAYSLVDSEVGYCQGSAFIAGLILMHLPEEQSFAVFVSLMQKYRLRELFKPSMAELGLCMFQFESLLQDHSPELHQHFLQSSFHTSSFAPSWFLTLMATTFNFKLASRILDVFISEGLEIIFRLGLALLLDNKHLLLTMDMEKMVMFVQKECPQRYNEQPDLLFDKAYSLVKYNPKKMKKVQKDYEAMKSKETDDQIETRRLKTENRLLLQRVDILEVENQNLADKLIQDRLNRAIDAEKKIRLEKELSIAKRQAQNVEGSGDARISKQYVMEIEKQLMLSKSEQADTTVNLTNLQEKCYDLEERNRELRDESRLAELEGELIAVKLREAEANNAMKTLVHNLHCLKQDYEKFVEEQMKPRTKNAKVAIQELQNALMKARVTETENEVVIAELKQAIMELETSNHVTSTQLQRCEEDRSTLREKCDIHEDNKIIFTQQITELLMKNEEADSKEQELKNELKLLQAEYSMKTVEMQQEISSLKHQLTQATTPTSVEVLESSNELIRQLQSHILKQQRQLEELRHPTHDHDDVIDDDELILNTDSILAQEAIIS